MEYLCLDIKYVWVHGDHRWYYLLSIMDVYSRKILIWLFQKSIRKMDVINLFRTLHQAYNLKGVFIRNDNGSQFIANRVWTVFKTWAKREFTHVATPDENSSIAAFHSIFGKKSHPTLLSSAGSMTPHLINYMKWYKEGRGHRIRNS